ncbi:hypothetical protein PGTUg99_024714 [Puccinia graminis f. sp. tritici]|uniref:Uncharacterized protein n=1 Tax=Puccinia graminis f. sp. tritici TaxID=56615 RepID=A0A5B0MV51_PUCGR|nr:hypothetical protein PGTUg99_024714 [Puccinia graminis f. sp. tritici]
MNQDTKTNSNREDTHSTASETTASNRNSSKRTAAVEARFARLNPALSKDEADSLFLTFVAHSELRKLKKFLDKLERVCEPLVQEIGVHARLVWCLLINGNLQRVSYLQNSDPTIYNQLFQLAYCLWYPKEHSTISHNEMLHAPQRPIPLGSQEDSQELLEYQWSTRFAQEGFQSEYKKPNTILDPVMETLQQSSKNWSPDKLKAPFASIIGPTMSGKTRLLMELGKKIPAVYICLRPKGSSGLPSRSKLADDILPEPRPKNLQLHYPKHLIAILEATAIFFHVARLPNLIRRVKWLPGLITAFQRMGKRMMEDLLPRFVKKWKNSKNSMETKLYFSSELWNGSRT